MTATCLDVVVRCRNEMPYARSVFRVLRHPDLNVVVFDNGSTDGSREAAVDAGFRIVDVAPEGYVPGRVINQAMRVTSSDVVCFVNADAIPESIDDVRRLADACRSGAAAAYGRQCARPGAQRTTRIDYDRVFPDRPQGPGFRHFFSMAASAIRRDVWSVVPFDEHIRYSEDIDWTYRLRGLGLRIEYLPDARFEHSHDYDRKGLWRRMVGEGVADRFIYRLGPPDPARQFALPLAAQLVRDLRSGVGTPSTAIDRGVAQAGRLYGRWTGWRAPPWGPPAQPMQAAEFFTHVRDPKAEAMIAKVLEVSARVIVDGLGRELEALLLIGGYAGGEGAVDWVDGAPRIHNDVDLVAVVSNARRARALRERCHELSEQASAEADACVDVFPIARDELSHTNGKLLWLDAAVRGVRLITGDSRVLDPLRKLASRTVVSGELGRLLMNRATGIAISRLSFAAGEDETARAARHVAKSWMALGDTLLLHQDRYARTGAERLDNLRVLSEVGGPWLNTIAKGYAAALDYRRSPAEQRVERLSLQSAAAEMWPCFAELEAYRLGTPVWEQPASFANERAALFPALVDVSIPARILAGPKAALSKSVKWSQSWRHPREILARASALLAFDQNEASARDRCADWLGLADSEPQRLREAIERLRELAA